MSAQITNILKRHEIQLKRLEESFEFKQLTKEQIAEYEKIIVKENSSNAPKPVPKPKVDVNRSGRFSRAYPPPKNEVPVKIESEEKTEKDDELSKLPPHLRRKMELLNRDKSKMIIEETTKKSFLSDMKQSIYEDVYKNFSNEINEFKDYIRDMNMDKGASKDELETINALKKENRDLSLELKKTRNDIAQLKDMYILFQKEFYGVKHGFNDFKTTTKDDVIEIKDDILTLKQDNEEIREEFRQICNSDIVDTFEERENGENLIEEEVEEEITEEVEEEVVEEEEEEIADEEEEEVAAEVEKEVATEVEEDVATEVEEDVATEVEVDEIQQSEQETQQSEQEIQQSEQETQQSEQETQQSEQEIQQSEQEIQQSEQETQQPEETNLAKLKSILEPTYDIKVNYKEKEDNIEKKVEQLLNKPKPAGFATKQRYGKKKRRR